MLGEWPGVMGVLDAGLLETDPERVRRAIAAGDVLVAVERDLVLGTLVLDPSDGGHPSLDPAWADATAVEAVAVRRDHRGRGLGSALVETAADRYGQVLAEFDDHVRPFWEALGFEVVAADEPGRCVGIYDGRRDG